MGNSKTFSFEYIPLKISIENLSVIIKTSYPKSLNVLANAIVPGGPSVSGALEFNM